MKRAGPFILSWGAAFGFLILGWSSDLDQFERWMVTFIMTSAAIKSFIDPLLEDA